MSKRFLGALPRRGAVPKVVSFATLLTIAIAIVLCEIVLFFLLPSATRRFEKRLERAEQIDTMTIIVPRVYESRRMIPPMIGVLYRRQTESTPPGTEALFRKLLALDDATRLRLLKKNPVSEDAYLAVLVRSYAGGRQEAQLEEFLVRAAPELQDGGYLKHGVAASLYRTYFYAGERSQYAGLIEDARLAYRRFLDLGRMLNRHSGLGIDMHLHLSRANTRLKVLAPEHAFATEAMESIQDGPAEETKNFINHPDPRLAALARYNAASFLWREDKADDAIALLEGPAPTAACCASNADSCSPRFWRRKGIRRSLARQARFSTT